MKIIQENPGIPNLITQDFKIQEDEVIGVWSGITFFEEGWKGSQSKEWGGF